MLSGRADKHEAEPGEFLYLEVIEDLGPGRW